MAASLPVSLHLSAASSSQQAVVESLHLLPFNIQYSGPANVKAYFDPQEISSSYTGEDGAYKAYFRGRALLGTRIALPAGYIGQIWKSNGPSISRVAVDERRKRERVAVASTGDATIEYSQDSPRRSPRKHGVPADGAEKQAPAKKQKLDTQKKKKKKQVKREMFDLDDGDAEGGSSINSNNPGLQAAVDLEDVAVTGLDASDQQPAEPVKSEDVDMQDGSKLAGTPQAEAEQTHEAEVLKTEEDIAPSASKVESELDPIIPQSSPIKAEPSTSMPRETIPPPPSSSAFPSSSMPGTPSTPHASAQMPIINIATPKPFSRAMEDDADAEQGEEAITERILEDVGTFEHVTIWNPDIALDKGEDVYVRALDEWTKLAEFVGETADGSK